MFKVQSSKLKAVGGNLKHASPARSDTLVSFGGAVKALGSGKVGGYLVLFSGPEDPDLAGDFFTADTDFDFDGATKRTTIYYDHCLDETIKGRKLGAGTLKIDEVGVWLEGQLNLRDDYEQAIYKLIEEGKLGWSSGTAAHLVEREPVKNAHHIKRWPLGLDATVTATPCEPRTLAVPLKAYKVLLADRRKKAVERASNPDLWRLQDNLCSVLWQLEYIAQGADTLQLSIDTAVLWREAVQEFAVLAVTAGLRYLKLETEEAAGGEETKSFQDGRGLQANLPLVLHSEAVQDAAEGLITRLKSLQETRGRALNERHQGTLKQLAAGARAIISAAESLVIADPDTARAIELQRALYLGVEME